MAFFRWWIPWEPSVVVPVAFAVAIWLYVRGIRRSPMTAPWRRQVFFWLGMLLLYNALHTHLDYYAEHEFFIHRIQHIVLHHLGPFLIVLAYPGVTMRRGMSLKARLRLRASLQWWPVRWTLNFLLNPFVAALIFVGLIYLWLWPAVHFDAMLDWRLYHLMNYSMAADGLLFWWLILDHRSRPPARLAPGMRIFWSLVAIVPQIVLGAYISLTDKNLYPIYSLCGRAFANISPLLDQHLGGLILWIPSAMMGVLGALVAFKYWLRLDAKGRLQKRQDRRAAWRARVIAQQAQGPDALAGRTGKST
ncbi:MAG: cytochrome c oxidase assembly protein [Gammaproteobacteria bacterium]